MSATLSFARHPDRRRHARNHRDPAAQLMREHHVGSLVVVDAATGDGKAAASSPTATSCSR